MRGDKCIWIILLSFVFIFGGCLTVLRPAAATEEFPRFSGGGAYKGAAGRINGGLWHRKAKWSVSSK